MYICATCIHKYTSIKVQHQYVVSDAKKAKKKKQQISSALFEKYSAVNGVVPNHIQWFPSIYTQEKILVSKN